MRTSSTTTLRQPATSTKGVRGASHTKRALAPASYPQAHHRVVAPSLKVADAAAASVFGAARLRGPIARDVIAQVTQLSIATVNRQVTALLDAGSCASAPTSRSPAPSAGPACRSRSTTSRS